MRNFLFILVTVLAVAVFGSLPAAAQEEQEGEGRRYLYQWTDERGVVHITDTLQSVPPKHRAEAQRIEAQQQEGRQDEAGPQAEQPAETPESDDEARKEEWQQRMREARERLASAEQQVRELEEEVQALDEKWGHGAYGYPAEVEAERKRLVDELEQVRIEVRDARRNVEVVLPEQARKEGVPPGWLRD